MSFRFTTIDEPNATQGYDQGTEVFGISLNTSVVVGGYTSAASTSTAFADFLGGFTTLGGPPGALSTYATDINDQGHVVGIFGDAGGLHGYFEAGGSFSPFNDPSAVMGTLPAAIDDSGTIVGFYLDGSYVGHAFTENLGFFSIWRFLAQPARPRR
jgi:uncharacterized membrane protein